MDSFNYTTLEGDRIDTLADKFYGGNYGIELIADANPHVPISAVYPIGTALIIPIIDDNETDELNILPPWKR